MKTFIQFIEEQNLSEGKNTHLAHIDQSLLVDGGKFIISGTKADTERIVFNDNNINLLKVDTQNKKVTLLESTSDTNTAISDQTTMFNMHDLTVETLNEQDLLLYSFELAIARPVNRIGFDNDNNFSPHGYSLGGYEVTGSLTCKRDAESLEAIDADMATPQALALSAGDVFQIDAPKCIIDSAGISMDDDGWKQTIPFTCTYSGATSSTIVSIKTA